MQWLEHKLPPPLFGLLYAIGMWWTSSGLQSEALGAWAAEAHRLQRVEKSPTSHPFFRR